MRRALAGLLVASLGMTRAALAEPPQATGAPTRDADPAPARRALAGASAVVPGVLVHGSGHFVAGDSDTGLALLLAEGVGIGMLLGGGTVLVLTGASRYVVGPAAAVSALGVGLFGVSFAADLYGTLSAESGAAALVPTSVAMLETELGYRYVSDPRFEYRHLAVERLSLRSGHFRLSPSAWFDSRGLTGRYRLEAAYRLFGPLPGEPIRGAGAELDVVVGAFHHRYVPERFTRTSGELAVEGRYDLGHIGPTLHGAFVEAGIGYGVARIAYDLQRLDVPADHDDLLLTRFGFGVKLRGRAAPGSEIVGYYDHRHDDFAAGFLMPGLGSGVIGHFGLDARWFFTPELGVLAQTQIGAAWLGGVSLLVRQGARSTRSTP